VTPGRPGTGRIAELPPEDRPREKLVARGADALTDEELVAVLLGYGRAGAGVLETAREVLRGSGLRGLLARSERGRLRELARGVGLAKACRLAAAGELAHRGVEHGLLDVGDHDARAVVEQRLDETAAHPVRAAGHHRDPAREALHHHVRSPRCRSKAGSVV